MAFRQYCRFSQSGKLFRSVSPLYSIKQIIFEQPSLQGSVSISLHIYVPHLNCLAADRMEANFSSGQEASSVKTGHQYQHIDMPKCYFYLH